jgi:hypothetical protein
MASNAMKKAAATTEDTLRALLVVGVLAFAAIYVTKGKSP